jgi:uncharacterized protein YigE (DUF2233 family)
MRINLFFKLAFLQSVICISSYAFSQTVEQNVKDSASIKVQPKALLQPNQKKIKDKNKESIIKPELSETDKTTLLLQQIIENNKEDLSLYEKLHFENEHLEYLLNDTLSSDIQRNQLFVKKTNDSMWFVLNNYGESYADSVKRNKIQSSTLDILKSLIVNEGIYKDSSSYFQKKKIQKENDLANTKKQLDKINVKLKPNIDSLNKLILNLKKPEVFKIVYNKVSYRILVAPTKYTNVRIHNNAKKNLQPLNSVLQSLKEKPVALLNAGMFDGDGSAHGLMIMNNKLINDIDLTTNSSSGNFYLQPNGVFYIDSIGSVHVTRTSDYKKNIYPKQNKFVSFATQSGPMLLFGGKSNPNFSINSTNRNIRNGVGVVDNASNKMALFIISDNPCTFYDLAALFRLFKCSNALYLDGAISKMYTNINGVKTGNLNEGNLGPIISVSIK